MHYWEMEGEGDSLHVLDLASDAVSYSSKEVARRTHGSLDEQSSAPSLIQPCVYILTRAGAGLESCTRALYGEETRVGGRVGSVSHGQASFGGESNRVS